MYDAICIVILALGFQLVVLKKKWGYWIVCSLLIGYCSLYLIPLDVLDNVFTVEYGVEQKVNKDVTCMIAKGRNTTFTLTSETSSKSIAEFIKDKSREYWFYCVNGDDYEFSDKLGKEPSVDEILKLYDSIRSKGIAYKDDIVVKCWIFYILR